jgi:hypothetical protein
VTKLDELLSYDEDHRHRGPQRRRGWLRLFAAVVACALSAFAVQSVLRVFGYTVEFPIALGVALAIVGLTILVNRIGPGRIPDTLFKAPPRRVSFDDVSEDGVRDGVKNWQMRLDWTGQDATRFAAGVQPALVELIDERLRSRHGVSRASDPERARDLLGPELWRFVNEPVRRRPTARDLAPLVAAMEAL